MAFINRLSHPALWMGIAFFGIASCAQPYAVGDVGPAGGLIFYDEGSTSDGFRYLEAAPAGWHAGTKTDDLSAAWGCNDVDIAGTSDVIGSGRSNTEAILDQCPEAGTAARLSSDAEFSGYADWFLPSRAELQLMYENLHENGAGDFAERTYWSSTANTENSAWHQFFLNGSHKPSTKDTGMRFRPIRAF